MPRRSDLRRILIVGSGPPVIGRPGELDWSSTQGCRALREEGCEVVLVASDPATIPEMAERAYVEPLTGEYVTKIVERERPDALLSTLGGQTALDLAVALSEDGTLARFGVELIGAGLEAIRRAGDPERFRQAVARVGLDVSPVGALPLDPSAIGWKQLEVEVMRDAADAVVVICAIESVDPVGVHPADSISVAPAQTLSDEDRRRLREAAAAVIRAIGVETGSAGIRFALDPQDGRLVVLGVTPRVGRSAALASRATGVPIARISAKLAVGYTLDELPDDVGREMGRVDHCVVTIPRWAFETFPDADRTLTVETKAVGETMAIGRTFKEALQKAVRSLEQDARGLTLGRAVDPPELARLLEVPTPERLFAIAEAYRRGWSTADVHASTRIDRWFLEHVRDLVAYEDVIATRALGDRRVLRRAKRWGFADARIAELTGGSEREIRALRLRHGITPTFRTTGAVRAPCLYSTYADGDGGAPPERPGVVILGSGPGRIGQGIEFDHCCVHAASALRARGVAAVLVDCNPQATSTDADTSNRLYLEPVTLEDVLNVVDRERPLGLIVQFGGETPSALAAPLQEAGVRILGTSPDAIDRARDRERFGALLAHLGLTRAAGATVRSLPEARAIAARLGYPVLVRAASVPGDRATHVVHDDAGLRTAVGSGLQGPIRIDTFLEEAIAVAVDAVSDGRQVFVGGVMEHIEKAGIHSGDAACALPPYSLGPDQVERLHRQTAALARGLGVVGLLEVRFALKSDVVYVLEVIPRASRTVPFVSSAIGVPLARLATGILLGDGLPAMELPASGHIAVKEAVFPFVKFPGVDVVLGPEMKSTGVVMGFDRDFRQAYLKSQLAAGARLPTAGGVWISVRSCDRRPLVMLAKRLGELGFSVVAAGETAQVLRRHGMAVEEVPAGADEHSRVLALMGNGEIGLAIDIPEDGPARARSAPARHQALRQNIPYYTTLDGARAVIGALEVLLKGDARVLPLPSHGAPRTAHPTTPHVRSAPAPPRHSSARAA
jgi:carbamoyl-phosphate synthase large subunit